jgi:serine/threonine protein kinase
MKPALDLTSGASIGKYEVLRKLATGGMAEIYLARVRGTAGFEKIVVLKRILPHFAEDPTFVQMFLDEARLAATLQHPNIADVYDVGENQGSYFFTMEFVHGEDARTVRIAAKKRGVAIPRPIALAIVHGTAAALAYAHDKMGPEGPLGLVHRDVSSSNVLVSFDGAVKLVDFGIARATTRRHKTQTGTLKGKIPYMSPEQCQNRPLDRRSDLFSLGVVLYELTVGRRPFRGESDFEILDQIINKGAPRPTSIDPEYPADLESIVMKLLERQRDARYQTCEELVRDLEAFMSSTGAWVSAMSLGRYMRDLFADKINAWEAAMADGTTLGDHVASVITSESQRAERRNTPPSVAIQPEPLISVQTTAAPAAARRPQWLWAAIGGGALVAAVIGYVALSGSGEPSSAAGASDSESTKIEMTPAAARQPTTAAPKTPPAAPEAPSAAPAGTPPAAPADTTAAASPDTASAAPGAPASPPAETASAKPAATKPAAKPRAAAKPPVTKPAAAANKTAESKPAVTKPADTTTKPKDAKWDRNSLSLPKR